MTWTGLREFGIRIARRLALALGVLVVTGCVLINPHLRLSDVEAVKCESPASLEDGIQCANGWRDKYRDALGSHAHLRSWTGITLIAASGLAIGHGIAGYGGDTASGLAVGGASTYGIASWLESKPAQRAYVAGSAAMTCAVDVILPLEALPEGGQAFAADLGDLNTAIGAADQKRQDASETPAAISSSCSSCIATSTFCENESERTDCRERPLRRYASRSATAGATMYWTTFVFLSFCYGLANWEFLQIQRSKSAHGYSYQSDLPRVFSMSAFQLLKLMGLLGIFVMPLWTGWGRGFLWAAGMAVVYVAVGAAIGIAIPTAIEASVRRGESQG